MVRVFSNQNHSLKLEIIYICFDYQDEYEILQEREDELKMVNCIDFTRGKHRLVDHEQFKFAIWA